jgi:hypothetical protein
MTSIWVICVALLVTALADLAWAAEKEDLEPPPAAAEVPNPGVPTDGYPQSLLDALARRHRPSTTEGKEPPTHVSAYLGVDFSPAGPNSRGGNIEYLGATIAPFGNLEQSGFRFSLFGGRGSYKYDLDLDNTVNTGNGNTDTITTTVIDKGNYAVADALAGYEFVYKNFSNTLLVGVNFQDHQLVIPDPGNAVQGTKFGLKIQEEVSVNPTERTMIEAQASYSTAWATYRFMVKAGYDISNGKDMFFGPQFTAQGNINYDQLRIGAHLSSLKIGALEFTLTGGYFFDVRSISSSTSGGQNETTGITTRFKGGYAGVTVGSDF